MRSRYGQTTVSSCKMIDAEMYGMMPSAKIVMFDSAPPENRSMKPKKVPCNCAKKSRTAAELIPGVGMLAPIRNTASRPKVNSTLWRRSGMEKMFRMVSIIPRPPEPCPRLPRQ